MFGEQEEEEEAWRAADSKKLSQARNWMANHAAIFFASRVKRNCLHEAFHDDDDDDDACHQKGKWLPSPRPLKVI